MDLTLIWKALLIGVVERTLGGAVECFALFEHGAAVQADDEVQDAAGQPAVHDASPSG